MVVVLSSCAPCSPEAVLCLVVGKARLGQLGFETVFVDVEVVAQGVERGVGVAQFHVDDAEQHHRVFGQFVHGFVVSWASGWRKKEKFTLP